MCFQKYKQIVSQMPTCVFPNTNVSQTQTFILTDTSKLFHVNMCLHKYKQILSQIQMFLQIKTQQNCFRYVDRKASSDSWPPPPTNGDENM